jgi:hypothetical protein
MDFEEDHFELPDDVISKDDALSYVCENEWENVEEVFRDLEREEWLKTSKTCLELLSVISQKDRAHMRGGIKKWLRKKQNDGDDVTEEQLFAIAADVCGFVEELANSSNNSKFLRAVGLDAYARMHRLTAAHGILVSANSCGLDDLQWAKDLLAITRAFCDFLSEISDPGQEPFVQFRIRGPIEVFNKYLRAAPAQLLVHWRDQDGDVSFGRSPDPELPNLSSFIANWIAEYLTKTYPYVSLGVCAECGRFFSRERRDKTFCSKTCQNRVAYKRKKLLESNALTPVNVAPDDACDIAKGLWLHHPRFGIGLVEAVGGRAGGPVRSLPGSTQDAQVVQYRSMLSRMTVLQVRFLHGARLLRFADLFEGQKKEEQLPQFYEVKSEETLAELL